MAMVQEKPSQNPVSYYSYNLFQSSIFDRRTAEQAPKVRIFIVDNQNDDVGYSTPTDVLIVLQERKLRVFGQDRPFNIEDKEDCLSLIQDLKSKGQDCHLLNLVDMGGSVYGELSTLVHSYLGFIKIAQREAGTKIYFFL